MRDRRESNARYRRSEGSVLAVVIIFATIAALAIGSYIRLAGTEMRLANLQFYGNASLNLAEAGVEEALYAINLSTWSDEGWEVGDDSNVVEKTVSGVKLGSGGVGTYRVRVTGVESVAPMIVSEGEVLSGGGAKNVRQIAVFLYSRSLFANGIMANDIKFRGGNIEVNSMSSITGEILESAKVASTSLTEGSMDLGNATIYGSVATRGWDPVTRPNSEITGGITNDFNSDLPDVKMPDYDGVYLEYDGGPGTLGGLDSDDTYYYRTSNLTLSNDEVLAIQGNVILIVDSDIDIAGGGASIVVEDGASLELYVGGDVFIGGSGMVNESEVPANMQLYGTNPDSQEFTLAGNAEWYGTVYAPTAAVEMKGGGSDGVFYGAVVSDSVTMRGGTTFYYDVELVDLVDGNSFGMANWSELYGDDRYTLHE